MESGDVLEESWRKVGAKEVADAMGVSLSLVYKWAAPKDQGGAINPLDRVTKLLECTGDTEILVWLCRQADGYFLANPVSAGQAGDEELLSATQNLVSRFATLLSSIATAAADSRITAEEAQDIRELWDQLKSHAEGFVRSCEAGTYQQ